MVAYVVVDNMDLTQLVNTVNNLISQGYVPTGGVSMVANPNDGHQILFAQAMVLKSTVA